MRIRGIINWAAYVLSQHRVWGVPLLVWLAALAVAWAILVAISAVPLATWSIALAVFLVLLAAVFLVARQIGYILFRSEGHPSPQVTRSLKPEEKVPVRASGFFEVSGMRTFFVNIRAWFETVQTREHIVIGHNPTSRLLVAKTSPAEQGMWYAFFSPSEIRDLEIGQLHFGLRARTAVRIRVQPEDGGEHALYLAFDDQNARDLVLNDLLADVEEAGQAASGATVAGM